MIKLGDVEIINKKLIAIGIMLVLSVELSGCMDDEDKLIITSLGREGEYSKDFIFWDISIKIENIGNNDVNDAELILNLFSGGNIIDSRNKIICIDAGFSQTTGHMLIENNFNIHDIQSYKLVATIYLDDEVLDTHTLEW